MWELFKLVDGAYSVRLNGTERAILKPSDRSGFGYEPLSYVQAHAIEQMLNVLDLIPADEEVTLG